MKVWLKRIDTEWMNESGQPTDSDLSNLGNPINDTSGFSGKRTADIKYKPWIFLWHIYTYSCQLN